MVPGTWEHSSLVDDNTSQGRAHWSMVIRGHTSRYFTSNLPTGPELILLFCRRRWLAAALIHKGIYGTRIPQTAVRSMHPECFCKPGTCTRKGDFTHSPYPCISLNTVTLKKPVIIIHQGLWASHWSMRNCQRPERDQTDFPYGTVYCLSGSSQFLMPEKQQVIDRYLHNCIVPHWIPRENLISLRLMVALPLAAARPGLNFAVSCWVVQPRNREVTGVIWSSALLWAEQKPA